MKSVKTVIARKGGISILKYSNVIAFLSAATLAFPAFAGKRDPSIQSLNDIVKSNVKFVLDQQVTTPGAIYGFGEFPTRIESTALPVLVGVGKLIGTNDEATAYSTGMVANALASLYLTTPELRSSSEFQKIPSVVSAADASLERFRTGALYNFYPKREWKGTTVHQAIDMKLAPWWKGLTNVAEDADTTSVSYATHLYNAILKGESYKVPQEALDSLQTFRDLNRKPHFYNKQQHRQNTGAFLTWQMADRSSFPVHTWFDDPKDGQRIPFGRNDVDCIVNANVLRMLALNKSQDLPGREEACNMINDMIMKDESIKCGIYYPNSFNLGYSMAQVEKVGGACLQDESKKHLIDMILKNQSEDGSWSNVGNTWPDHVQSTIFAMEALLELEPKADTRVQSSLLYGTQYLISQLHRSNSGQLYWKGETFFTATAIARELIIWKSDAYTTAIGSGVLTKMAKRYPQYTETFLNRLR